MDEYFYHLRTNINDYIEGDISEFNYNETNDETSWNSASPLTTVFSIDIKIFGSSNVGDDGSVICSQGDGFNFIFSTIKAPQGFSMYPNFELGDGYHPVSGNRQFGVFQEPNGSYSIITKGADKAKFNAITGFFGAEEETYAGGDRCWKSFLDGVNKELSQEGSIVLSVDGNMKGRSPNWDAIENLLTSVETLDYIPCY